LLKKYLLLLITGIIFGSQFIITKYAIEGYTPLEVGVARVVFGMIALVLFAPLFTRQKQKLSIPWYSYALIGFLEGTLPCFLVSWGQQQVKTGIAAVIISTMPIFAMIFGPIFIKNEKFRWVYLVSIIAGFVGVCILINPGMQGYSMQGLLPEVAILVASASWALSLVFIKRLPSINPFILTRNILIAASIEIIPIWLVFGEPIQLHFALIPLVNAILLGVLSSGLVYIFYVLLIRLSGVNFAAFSNYLVPIVGGFIGIVFLKEKVTTQEIIGFIIIVFALLFLTFYEHRTATK